MPKKEATNYFQRNSGQFANIHLANPTSVPHIIDIAIHSEEQTLTAYNRTFDLGIDDLELIETALLKSKKDLSLRRLELLSKGSQDALADVETSLADTQDLLGRLHNQKVFYRPSQSGAAPYIGG